MVVFVSSFSSSSLFIPQPLNVLIPAFVDVAFGHFLLWLVGCICRCCPLTPLPSLLFIFAGSLYYIHTFISFVKYIWVSQLRLQEFFFLELFLGSIQWCLDGVYDTTIRLSLDVGSFKLCQMAFSTTCSTSSTTYYLTLIIRPSREWT